MRSQNEEIKTLNFKLLVAEGEISNRQIEDDKSDKNIVPLENSEETRELFEVIAVKSTDFESGDKNETVSCDIYNAEILFQMPVETESNPILPLISVQDDGQKNEIPGFNCDTCPKIFKTKKGLNQH